MGKETMLDTHAYLRNSMAFGCERFAFESITNDFNTSVKKVLKTWGINPHVHAQLVQRVQKLDLSRKSAEQLKADHHHTASKFPPGFKKQVKTTLAHNDDVMALIKKQRRELGYDPETGDLMEI